MPDLKKYWQEVRAIEKGLPEYVWLMSLDNPSRGHVGGCVVEVAASVAAKLLHNGSHRRATEEEIASHREKEERTKRQSLQQKLRRLGVSMVPVGEEQG
jgi:hypothetical protein